ncbi:early boundary activity protein 1-like [Spodoptera litura]|uniref:Early boundary activity protein 1-like n=1 Tax=Spodoptera litura TaxID=69820 RepID=A0A9J7IRB8_SPOLT|nr:early boundary activity protein 1-like [Spodoptera litura]
MESSASNNRAEKDRFFSALALNRMRARSPLPAPAPAPSTASASPAAPTPASREESNKIEEQHVETQDPTMNIASSAGEDSSRMVESPSKMVEGPSRMVESPSRMVQGPSKDISKTIKKIRIARRRRTSSITTNQKKEFFCNFLETCVRALDMFCNNKARKTSSSESQDDSVNKDVINTEENRPCPSHRHRELDNEDAESSNDRKKRRRDFNTNKNNNFFVQIVDSTPQQEWVGIGTGQTQLHRDKFVKLKWDSYNAATRSLLVAVFGKETLATHSLTGKKSPKYPDRPPKECLDPTKVNDIIIEVTNNFAVTERSIKNIITTKCADECKMEKMRIQKAENERKLN